MIIAINGKIGSGKDTIGRIIQFLVEYYDIVKKGYESNQTLYQEFIDFEREFDIVDHTWQVKKFADKLKDIVCLLTGCTREQLEDQEFKNSKLPTEWENIEHGDVPHGNITTYRDLLQYIGTDLFRNNLHQNVWVNSLMNEYRPVNNVIEKSNTFIDSRLKHGYNKTRIFRVYHNIKQRCNNSKHPRYSSYGERGIKLCKEWEESFESFINWSNSNGYKDNLTLDRKDNNEGYNPNNCRWVTYGTQAINTSLRKDNTTGYKGVSLDKKNNNRIRANIQIKGKIKFLGYFNTLEEASEAYEEAFLEREGLYEQEENKNLVYPSWCITDMRFPNEMKVIKDRGGITIRVTRRKPEIKTGNSATDFILNKTKDFGEVQHPSETALDNATFDWEIDNNGTIEELIEKVRGILIKEKLI